MIQGNTSEVLILIRKIMIEKHITIKELANRLNKSASATSGLLRQDNISLNTLLDICNALHCNLYIDIVPNNSVNTSDWI